MSNQHCKIREFAESHVIFNNILKSMENDEIKFCNFELTTLSDNKKRIYALPGSLEIFENLKEIKVPIVFHVYVNSQDSECKHVIVFRFDPIKNKITAFDSGINTTVKDDNCGGICYHSVSAILFMCEQVGLKQEDVHFECNNAMNLFGEEKEIVHKTLQEGPSCRYHAFFTAASLLLGGPHPWAFAKKSNTHAVNNDIYELLSSITKDFCIESPETPSRTLERRIMLEESF